MFIDSVRCVVLNASYDPLSIVSGRRGLMLCLKGKATMLESHADITTESIGQKFPVPTQIILNKMVKGRSTTRAKAQLTQRNLFVRDMFRCVYCGRHRSELKNGEILTRDHVQPLSRGGRDVWGNVVTSCNKCNNKKGNSTLEEVGMKLTKLPSVPTVFELWQKAHSAKTQRKPQ